MCEEAFQLLPATTADALWPQRIMFMSKLGMVRARVHRRCL